MSQHTKRVVILFSLLVSISVLSINSYGQGGSATKTPPSRTKQPTKSNKPVKRSTASSKTRQAPKANDSKSVEIAYWESIKNSTNPDDFRAYLNKYPNGEFVDLARNKISSLEAAAKDKTERERADRERQEAEDNRKAETAYWDSIKNSTDQENFRAYLRKYPQGQFADLAKDRIQQLENKGKTFSGGVLNGKAISKPTPVYPPVAKAAHAMGVVTVQVTIDENGNVISARAVSGHPLLQQSAVQAAYQAKFSPTLLSGQPVKVTGTLLYNFVLQ